ncbi:MAG: hypothetical protein R3D98_08675 [Candidatus Krumholzibacteriia bacterium]
MIALLLAILAAAAGWWPDAPRSRDGGTLLVLLPEADLRREAALEALTRHLAHAGRLDLRLAVVRDTRALRDGLSEALLVLGPDGPLLSLDPADWHPLVSGRRRAPWNLRPTSVLVSRRTRQAGLQPWRTAPARTVFGDSLSLVCLAPLCRETGSAVRPARVAWGSDPYDHRGVLPALERGAYDHAVVRQWDAAALVAAGRLPADRWLVQRLGDPMPDILVLAARRLPAATRLDLQQALTMLGRPADLPAAVDADVATGLGLLGLDGFNLLRVTDIERVRRRDGGCWPLTGE